MHSTTRLLLVKVPWELITIEETGKENKKQVIRKRRAVPAWPRKTINDHHWNAIHYVWLISFVNVPGLSSAAESDWQQVNVRDEWDGVERTAITKRITKLACCPALRQFPLFYQLFLLFFSCCVFPLVFLRVGRGIDVTPDPLGCGSFQLSWGQGLDLEMEKRLAFSRRALGWYLGLAVRKLCWWHWYVYLITTGGNSLTNPSVACNLGGLETWFEKIEKKWTHTLMHFPQSNLHAQYRRPRLPWKDNCGSPTQIIILFNPGSGLLHFTGHG